ncbi:acyltransferase [Chitinophaga sp. 212800010-3]|uniref:acyltransferase n=1 Tax=unclassified Chitinophaga TaxID=2619133 RepID=UPI002DEBD385|nr:Acyl-transf-3 domain-containing protein [Chitinophaga sp. 212800010-3]
MIKRQDRTNWIDNLRSSVTLLVVAHHSSLAYTTFAYFNKQAYITSTHPVVDTVRSRSMDLFEDFNDIFFMSLMFLISGLFIAPALRSKGVAVFIRDRFYRLFIPFAIGVTLLMLLAYYPAYYLAHGQHNLKDYIVDYFTVEAWPVGPPWFIWVLFLFNLVFALCYPAIGKYLTAPATFIAGLRERPLRLFFSWYLFTLILYIPAILLVDPGKWTGIGPFDFQISRLALYFGYFLLGILIGVPGTGNGIFAENTRFVRLWPAWIFAALVTYTLLKCSEGPLHRLIDHRQLSYFQASLLYRFVWSLSCTLSCIASLTTFRQLLNNTNTGWKSLSANAYGIYLVHYIPVIWCQYLLLNYDLPAPVKFAITVVTAVALSWMATWLVRRNSIVKRYL